MGDTRLLTEDGECHQPQGWAAPRCWKKQEDVFSQSSKSRVSFWPRQIPFGCSTQRTVGLVILYCLRPLSRQLGTQVGLTVFQELPECLLQHLPHLSEGWSSQCRRHGRQRERTESTCRQTARSDEDQTPKQRGDSRGEISP